MSPGEEWRLSATEESPPMDEVRQRAAVVEKLRAQWRNTHSREADVMVTRAARESQRDVRGLIARVDFLEAELARTRALAGLGPGE